MSSPFADDEKMKALHPRFRFHNRDWLTRHLVVKHCQARNRWFAKAGPDPDLKIYDDYMNNQRRERQNKAQQVLKKRLVKPPKQLVLPGPKVCLRSPSSIG